MRVCALPNRNNVPVEGLRTNVVSFESAVLRPWSYNLVLRTWSCEPASGVDLWGVLPQIAQVAEVVGRVISIAAEQPQIAG